MASKDLLYRILLDAHETALRRGDKYGLCDAIDNHGTPYPSAAMAEVIGEAVDYVARVDRIPALVPSNNACSGLCPVCGGDGYQNSGVRGKRPCVACDGTGQSR